MKPLKTCDGCGEVVERAVDECPWCGRSDRPPPKPPEPAAAGGTGTEPPRYRCRTKAFIAEGDFTVASPRWAVSRRAELRVFDDRLECGDWNVPYSEIAEALLHRGAGLLLPAYVLVVRTKRQTFQFGLTPNRYWREEAPFPLEQRVPSVRRRILVWTVRAAVLAAIAFLLGRRFLA